MLEWFRTHPTDGSYRVLIIGGSVAAGYAKETTASGRHPLAEHLLKSRNLSHLSRIDGTIGDGVEVLNYAHAAYKQPQQVMRLAYLLSMGYVPDLVINIDGYNEVSGGLFNASRGVHPLYPSPTTWGLWLTARNDQDSILARAELVRLAESKTRLGRLAESWGLARSSVASAVILRRLRAMNRTGAAIQTTLSRPNPDNVIEFRQSHGPDFDSEESAVRDTCVRNWHESSLSILAMCQLREIKYVHILQPSLCLIDSKPYSPEELAIVEATGRSRYVDGGFRALRTLGPDLRSKGVHFFDAMDLLESEERTAYIDPVHFNSTGRASFVEFLNAAVAEALRAQ